MGRIDHRGEHLDIQCSQIGYRECGTAQQVRTNGASLGGSSQFFGFLGDFRQGLGIRIENRGNQQPSRRIHRHAQVNVVKVTDLIIHPVGIQNRMMLQNTGDCIEYQIIIGNAGKLQRFGGFQFLAVCDDAAGVKGTMMGELRHGSQRIVHGIRNDLPHVGDLFIVISQNGGCLGRDGGRSLLIGQRDPAA